MRFILVVLVLVAPLIHGQTAPVPVATPAISGRVTNALTREPVRRANVKISAGKTEWDRITDREGRFSFPEIPPSDYRLIAHRDGYVDSTRTLQLSDFTKASSLDLTMQPEGVVTGTVLDRLSQPLHARVEVFSSSVTLDKNLIIDSAQTNDLGVYRVSGLPPGPYRIRANAREGRDSEFDPTPLTMAKSWYGGADTPAMVKVDAGSVTPNINFTLNLITPVKIRGTLHSDAGVFRERTSLWITDKSGNEGHNGNAQDGAFEIADVSSGTWVISVRTLSQPVPLSGVATVVVQDTDVNGIDIPLTPIPRFDGLVVVDGKAPAGEVLRTVMLTATERLDASPRNIGHPDADGKFTLFLKPGEYTISFTPPAGYSARAAFNGQPVANWKLTVGPEPTPTSLVITLNAASSQ